MEKTYGMVRAGRRVLGVVAVLALWLGGGTVRAQNIGPMTIYQTRPTTGPVTLAMGDVNGDGRPDAVTNDYMTPTVTVALGTVGGGFGPGTTYGSGTHHTAYNAVLGDVNNDGRLDIVTACPDTVGILLGLGNGLFSPAVPVRVSTPTSGRVYMGHDVALGDVNRDGRLDIVTANPGHKSVGVMLGTGSGTFGPSSFYSTGVTTNPSFVKLADLNGDNVLDAVAIIPNGGPSNSASAMAVMLGTGAGGFVLGGYYGTIGPAYISLEINDVNEDGHPDIVTGNINRTVGVLLGTGTGAFGRPVTYVTDVISSYYLALGDMDGDGHTDAVVSCYGNDGLSVLLGSGTGTFTLALTDTLAYQVSVGVALRDMNGDGRLDIVTAIPNRNGLAVLLGLGPALTVAAVIPNTAPVGATVLLRGINLGGATSVSFNGIVTTAISNNTPMNLEVVVPPGATNGPLTVTTGRFIGSSPFFMVTPLAALATVPKDFVAIFPTPATGRFTLRRPATAAAPAATLHNALGQLVRTIATPTAETVVDVRGLPAGIYTLRLVVESVPVARRVVLE